MGGFFRRKDSEEPDPPPEFELAPRRRSLPDALRYNARLAACYHDVPELIKQKSYQAAIDQIDRCLEIASDIGELYRSRAVCLADLGHTAKAIADLEVAIAYDPRDHQSWYCLGLTHGRLVQWSEAVDAHSEAIKIEPRHKYRLARARAHVMRRAFLLALEDLDAALHQRPDDAPTRILRGHCLEALQRNEEALESFWGVPDALWDQGRLMVALNRVDECLAIYRQVPAKVQDTAVFIHSEKAQDEARHGRFESAERHYSLARRLAPEFGLLAHAHGNVLGMLRRYDDAIAAYEAALADWWPALVRRYAPEANAETVQTVALGKLTCKRPPPQNSIDLRSNIAEVKLLQGKPEECLAMLMPLEASVAILEVQARACYELERFADALAHVERGADLGGSPLLYDTMALLLERAGKTDEAQEAWQQFLQNAPPRLRWDPVGEQRLATAKARLARS